LGSVAWWASAVSLTVALVVLVTRKTM